MDATAHKVPHGAEPHVEKTGSLLNWLRAAVLGADDGVVSIAALLVGVAGASNSNGFIFTAGVAGIVAGALSMAVGEYVSVSSQRDTEVALLEKERKELHDNPEAELAELTGLYVAKGLSPETARTVALELTRHDVFAAHVDAELNINPDDLSNPWHAGIASAVSYTGGGLIPLIAIALPSASLRIPVTFAAVLVALTLTGIASAKVGGASKTKAALRVVVGGMLAMIITFGIGRIFGVIGI